MSKKYANPPIAEALCEFQFIPSQPWDLTMPGLFYGKVKEKGFTEKQQDLGFGINFRPKEGRIEPKVEMLQRIQFLRPDKSAQVHIGPDRLGVHCLQPYPSWEGFKPLVLDQLGTYQEIGNPKGLNRVGLRYVNKIEFAEGQIELTDYFTYYPHLPRELPQIHEGFNVRVEIPYEGDRDRLLLTLASLIPDKPATLPVLLDLDYVMTVPDRVPIDQVAQWLERAHQVIENAFEACITDKCRSLFAEVR